MKKIVLCAAITALCTAPVAAIAEANFYGQLRISLDSVDADVTGPAANDGLTVTDNVSVFGFKAVSEGDGIKAFIHLQAGARADADADGRAFTQRFYFGGLKGDFGKVVYGRLTNAYKMPGFKIDPFYNHSSVNVKGKVTGGAGTYGLSPANNGFTNNSLEYTTPSLGAVKINVGLYIDDANTDEHGTIIGGTFKSGAINAGIQIASNGAVVTIPNIAANGSAMRLHGGYKADGWSVGGSFEQVDMTAIADATYIYLTGSYNVSAKTKAALSVGSVSSDINSGAADGTGVTAGFFQTVAPKTQVFASMSMVSLDAVGVAEPSVFSVGAIHKF
jgi:hypothetical protein